MNYDVSLTTFLSSLYRGIATPNRYKIRLHPPAGISVFTEGVSPFAQVEHYRSANNYINHNGMVEMMATQVGLPSRLFDMMEIRTYGVKQRLPFSISTSEMITIMFTGSSWLAERHYLELWQNIVANVGSNSMNYPDEYLGSVEIILLDREGNESYVVILDDAFPQAVQQIDLNYSSNNIPLFVPSNWSFKTWRSPVPQGD